MSRFLYTLLWLLLIPVFALAAVKFSDHQAGDVIPQAEMDVTDFSKVVIPLGSPTVEIVQGEIKLSFTATTLQKTSKGIIVVSEPKLVTYEVENYANCRQAGQPKSECVTFVRQVLLGMVEEGKQLYRDQFNDLKTKVNYSDELTVDDLNITAADLSAVP